MFDQIRQLLVGKFQLEARKVTPESTLEDLGLDSLDTVELAMTIEQEWGPRVTDDELTDAQRLDAIAELVRSRAATT